MRRSALGCAVAAAALALAVGAQATQVVHIDSTVTIHSNGLHFSGKVKSPKSACRQGRKVRLFIVRQGPDLHAGADTTNAQGNWSINPQGFAGISMSKFYARVKKRSEGTAGTIFVCKPDRSPTIHPSF
jgi:hypothetical protein